MLALQNYVTTGQSVAGKHGRELEQFLGFGAGALAARAADRAFDQVTADELVKLNVRNSPARIVKVRGAQGKDFPNARIGNAPQWVLRVAERFKAA